MCHLGKPDKNWPKGPGSKESFTKKIDLRQFFFHLSFIMKFRESFLIEFVLYQCVDLLYHTVSWLALESKYRT